MSNKIRICNQCPTMKWKFIAGTIKRLDNKAELKIGCQSSCRLGYKKMFCFINGEQITACNREELMNRVRFALVQYH